MCNESQLVFSIIYIIYEHLDARSKFRYEEKRTLELNGNKLTTMKSKCVHGHANKLTDEECSLVI